VVEVEVLKVHVMQKLEVLVVELHMALQLVQEILLQ
tara:strand:+ start:110 stop:217 length:108 start_codon:yes stop_codon:yes gene_type:complete